MVKIAHYYWIATRDEAGKPFLVKGGHTEEEARMRGFELLQGTDFEIKDYPTTDIRMASAYLRGVRLEDTHSLSESSRRIGHEKSVKYYRRY